MNATTTQVLFKREPQGFPTADDFDIVKLGLPELAPGQLLVKGLYLSLDPYMRMLMGGGWKFRGTSMAPGQVMAGRVLGVVLESRNAGFKPGEFAEVTIIDSDGNSMEEDDEIEQLLSPFGFGVGFGGEYPISEKFAVFGEYGYRAIFPSLVISLCGFYRGD